MNVAPMKTSAPERFPLLAAGILGAAGVALGALGAHRLQAVLAERGMTHAWETGSRYHLIHAIALLAAAALVRGASAGPRTARVTRAAWCWCIGTVLFSGSLYWFALGGPHPLVYVTPIGGVGLIAGWVFLIAAGFASTDTAA